LLGALVAFLARRTVFELAVLATFLALSYIGGRLASSPQVSVFGLVGALVVAGMIFAFGTIIFVVGRKQDAEASAERGDGTTQSGGQHDGSGEAGESPRRD